jgi:hypothetical protein
VSPCHVQQQHLQRRQQALAAAAKA